MTLIPLSAITKRVRKVYENINPKIEKQAEDLGATCKKGCDACCHQLVGCTFAEALVIAEWLIDLGITAELPADVLVEVCPFLVGGICSIYPVRPLACRLHFAVSDPKECSPGGSPQLILPAEGDVILARQPADSAMTSNDDLLALYGPMPQFVAHAIDVLRGKTKPQILELENWRRKLLVRLR